MSQTASTDFSERLDKLWDFNKPADSEQRFRAELAKHPAGSREALETSTQIARTQGLQRKFAQAARDCSTPSQPKLDQAPTRVRVRYLLERGRTRNSGGDKAAAIPLFNEAASLRARDTLPGADFYEVDALHMLGIATPAAEQLDWNRKALAAAEASSDPRARGLGRVALRTTSAGRISTPAIPRRRSPIGKRRCRCARRKATPRTSASRSGRSRAGYRAVGQTRRGRGDPDEPGRGNREGRRARWLRLRGTRRNRRRSRRQGGRSAVGRQGVRATEGRRLPQGQRSGAPAAARAIVRRRPPK